MLIYRGRSQDRNYPLGLLTRRRQEGYLTYMCSVSWSEYCLNGCLFSRNSSSCTLMICAFPTYYIWYISKQEFENGIESEEGHAAMDAGFHTLRGPGPSHLDVSIYLMQTQVLAPGLLYCDNMNYMGATLFLAWKRPLCWWHPWSGFPMDGEEVRQLPMWTVGQGKFQHQATPQNGRWKSSGFSSWLGQETMGEREVPYYLVPHFELQSWISPQLVNTHLFLCPSGPRS